MLAPFAWALIAAPASPTAHEMRATIYDDGRSCPGGCDAHVVFDRAHNGTSTASDPTRPRAAAAKCAVGGQCRICFSGEDASCMVATYRGGGPTFGTFDFTPAFYAENCARSGIPVALAQQCASLDRAVVRTGYNRRTNCVATPADPGCAPVIAAAERARAADEPKYRQCLALGERTFNARQAGAGERRSNACSYTQLKSGGPNSAGTRWRKLLPAACRPGTYVGRDGLDCCSKDLRFAASTHPECSAFMLPRS